jgi:hypothetical protein
MILLPTGTREVMAVSMTPKKVMSAVTTYEPKAMP